MTYYDLLKIPISASPAEIKSAYRKLAKTYHPDMNHGKSAKERTYGEAKFRQVKDAYEILIDGEKRREYDRKLEIGQNPPKPQTKPTAKTYPQSPQRNNNTRPNPPPQYRPPVRPQPRPAANPSRPQSAKSKNRKPKKENITVFGLIIKMGLLRNAGRGIAFAFEFFAIIIAFASRSGLGMLSIIALLVSFLAILYTRSILAPVFRAVVFLSLFFYSFPPPFHLFSEMNSFMSVAESKLGIFIIALCVLASSIMAFIFKKDYHSQK
ncbi:MAG: DnaJ domain-containing protein [Oscillospiraceae bacterium]|nr:DnaJ domain-containing protein [Oscillospiraceae bacterium]